MLEQTLLLALVGCWALMSLLSPERSLLLSELPDLYHQLLSKAWEYSVSRLQTLLQRVTGGFFLSLVLHQCEQQAVVALITSLHLHSTCQLEGSSANSARADRALSTLGTALPAWLLAPYVPCSSGWKAVTPSVLQTGKKNKWMRNMCLVGL